MRRLHPEPIDPQQLGQEFMGLMDQVAFEDEPLAPSEADAAANTTTEAPECSLPAAERASILTDAVHNKLEPEGACDEEDDPPSAHPAPHEPHRARHNPHWLREPPAGATARITTGRTRARAKGRRRRSLTRVLVPAALVGSVTIAVILVTGGFASSHSSSPKTAGRSRDPVVGAPLRASDANAAFTVRQQGAAEHARNVARERELAAEHVSEQKRPAARRRAAKRLAARRRALARKRAAQSRAAVVSHTSSPPPVASSSSSSHTPAATSTTPAYTAPSTTSTYTTPASSASSSTPITSSSSSLSGASSSGGNSSHTSSSGPAGPTGIGSATGCDPQCR